MKNLNADLKSGNFKNYYLLFGEEQYLVSYYKKKLVEALAGPEDSRYSFTEYRDSKLDLESVISDGITPPFLTPNRLILIEDSGLCAAGSSKAESLLEAFPDFPETTYVIFSESKVDKRSKLYKFIKKNGYAAELKYPSEKDLLLWIASYLKNADKKITAANARHLLDRAGTDMMNLSNELEKVISYCMDREEITAADIDAVCVVRPADRIFSMMEELSRRNQEKTLAYYNELLASREPAMRILYMITRQFRILLQLKDMETHGIPDKSMSEKIKVHPFVVKKNLPLSRKMSYEFLEEAYRASVQASEDIFSGKIRDQLAVELLLVRFSS